MSSSSQRGWHIWGGCVHCYVLGFYLPPAPNGALQTRKYRSRKGRR